MNNQTPDVSDIIAAAYSSGLTNEQTRKLLSELRRVKALPEVGPIMSPSEQGIQGDPRSKHDAALREKIEAIRGLKRPPGMRAAFRDYDEGYTTAIDAVLALLAQNEGK